VALRLICEREAEINAFEPKEFWRLEANFWRDELPPFKASLEKWEGQKAEIDTQARALELKTACETSQAVLSEIKRSSRNVEPPPPLSPALCSRKPQSSWECSLRGLWPLPSSSMKASTSRVSAPV
jgi:DNA topoisomerase-1